VPARRIASLAIATAVFVSLACAGDGTGIDDGNDGDAPTFAADVQPIFSANCAFSGCHATSDIKPSGRPMDLSPGQAYASTVNVESFELVGMDRVEPGEPDESYLVHKIQGTQSDVGGSGGQMPLGGQLSAAEIETIRAWIAAGAVDN
jgi:hypothetical protein